MVVVVATNRQSAEVSQYHSIALFSKCTRRIMLQTTVSVSESQVGSVAGATV